MIFRWYKDKHNIIAFRFPNNCKLRKFISFSIFAEKDNSQEISIRVFFYKYAIEFEIRFLWVDIYFRIGVLK